MSCNQSKLRIFMDFQLYVYYDETSPTCLRNQVFRNSRAPKDQIAGSRHIEDEYSTININKIRYKTHRVVWELFNGPIPEGLVIDHIDGDKHNNKISNLRCVTKQQNTRFALQSLTDQDVSYIRQVYKPYSREFGTRALARKFKVHHSTIESIVNNVSYKN